MTCEQTFPLLSAYFDRELDVGKSFEIAAHLNGCARCAAALKQHEALRSALGAAPLGFTPPKHLEARLRSALRREARSRFLLAPWRWTAIPVTAALAAALAWGLAMQRASISGEQLLLGELVSGHVRSLMVDHLVDVATSDQHTVKPWFNGKVDFAPPVFDFTGSGFPLIGGRVDYVAGRPVAVVVYKRRQHVVNVFIWPSARDERQGPRAVAFQGYHLLRWTRSGLTFWAVSDVNEADLESLARLIQDAA